MKRRRRRRGFVLVMTMVLIAMASILLAGTVQHSLAISLAAHEAAAQVQRRWGVASSQRVATALSEQLLADLAENAEGQSLVHRRSHSRVRFDMGEQRYTLCLADEQAKANVNLLDRNMDDERLSTVVPRLSGRHGLTLWLRPLPSKEVATDGRAYRSWGQVFVPDSVAASDFPSRLDQATTKLTLWSAGSRLHLWGASDEAVEEVGGLVLNRIEIAELLALRPEYGSGDLQRLLEALDLPVRKRDAMNRLLVDSCGAVSLWVHVEQDHQRWHHFSVRITDAGVTRTFTSVW